MLTFDRTPTSAIVKRAIDSGNKSFINLTFKVLFSQEYRKVLNEVRINYGVNYTLPSIIEDECRTQINQAEAKGLLNLETAQLSEYKAGRAVSSSLSDTRIHRRATDRQPSISISFTTKGTLSQQLFKAVNGTKTETKEINLDEVKAILNAMKSYPVDIQKWNDEILTVLSTNLVNLPDPNDPQQTVNAKVSIVGSMLHFIAAANLNKYLPVVHQLLEAKADINLLNDEKQSPLMLAADSGNALVVEKLLEAGAKDNMPDNKGKTAFNYAVDKAHLEIVLMLFDHFKKKPLGDKYIQQAFYVVLNSLNPILIKAITNKMWGVVRLGIFTQGQVLNISEEWLNIFNNPMPIIHKTPLSMFLTTQSTRMTEDLRRQLVNDFLAIAKENLAQLSFGDITMMKPFMLHIDHDGKGSALHHAGCLSSLQILNDIIDFASNTKDNSDKPIFLDLEPDLIGKKESPPLLVVAAKRLHVASVIAILNYLNQLGDDKGIAEQKKYIDKADSFNRTPLYMVAKTIASLAEAKELKEDKITDAKKLIKCFIKLGANVNAEVKELEQAKKVSSLELLVKTKSVSLVRTFLRACYSPLAAESTKPASPIAEGILQRALMLALTHHDIEMVRLLTPLVSSLESIIPEALRVHPAVGNIVIRFYNARKTNELEKETRKNELDKFITKAKPIKTNLTIPEEKNTSLFGGLSNILIREQNKKDPNPAILQETMVILQLLLAGCRQSASCVYSSLDKIDRFIALKAPFFNTSSPAVSQLKEFREAVKVKRLKLHAAEDSELFYPDLITFVEKELRQQAPPFLTYLETQDIAFFKNLDDFVLPLSPSVVEEDLNDPLVKRVLPIGMSIPEQNTSILGTSHGEMQSIATTSSNDLEMQPIATISSMGSVSPLFGSRSLLSGSTLFKTPEDWHRFSITGEMSPKTNTTPVDSPPSSPEQSSSTVYRALSGVVIV